MLKGRLQKTLAELNRPLEVEDFLCGSGRTLPAVVVAGDGVLEWHWFRARVERLGAWPLVLASDEGCQEGLDSFLEDAPPVESILNSAESLEPLRALPELEPAEGSWPEATSQTRFRVTTRLRAGLWQRYVRRQPERHRLLLVPTVRPWEVFAWLNYSAGEGWIQPALHVAVHRQWHDRWGSEPVILASDTVECRVEHPPATREEALALARMQSRYCDDIVSQEGDGTVALLASRLLNSKVWRFWWD